MNKVIHRLLKLFKQLDTFSTRLSAAIVFVCVVIFTLMAWVISTEFAEDVEDEILDQLEGKLALIPQLDKADFSDEQLQNLLQTLFASKEDDYCCLLYTSPSPRDQRGSRMPSSA